MVLRQFVTTHKKWLLVAMFVLDGLEAWILTGRFFFMAAGSNNAGMAGSSSFRLGLALVMTLLGLLMMGLAWACLRRETIYKKINGFFEPPQRDWMLPLTGLASLAGFVLVFWWQGMLLLALPQYDAVYQRLLPLMTWFMLAAWQSFGLVILNNGLESTSNETGDAAGGKPFQPWQLGLSVLCCLLTAGFCFYLIQANLPRQVILNFRYGFITLAPLLILVFAVAVSQRRWWAGSLGLMIVLPIFTLTLCALWLSGTGEDNIVVGLFPWMDANSYYMDALRMVNGFTDLSNWGGRPLFQTFLAFILMLNGQNLQISLVVLVWINALCSLFLAREVTRHSNLLGGALTLLLAFLYYRQFAGTTLSENLGLPVGLLALAFLLRGIRFQRWPEQILGIFLASLALNIRPGPFFILPALLAWVFLSGRGKSRQILHLSLAVLAVAAGFMINIWLVGQLPSGGDAVMFSRFPHTLYGLAVGGKNWGQIYIDHPDVTKLADPRQSMEIYRLAFEAVKANPFNVLYGSGLMIFNLAVPNLGIFVFIRGENGGLVLALRILFYLLSGLAIWFSFRRRREPLAGLLLWLCAGIILSAPFVPVSESDRMRTYAAVVPVIILLPSLAVGWLSGKKMNPQMPGQLTKTSGWQRWPAVAVTLLFVAIIGTSLVWVRLGAAKLKAYSGSDCPGGQTAYSMKILAGSYTHQFSPGSGARTHLPLLSIDDFNHSIREFSYRQMFAGEQVEAGTLIVDGIDLRTGSDLKAVLPEAALSQLGRTVQFCAKQKIKDQGVFWYADSFETVAATP